MGRSIGFPAQTGPHDLGQRAAPSGVHPARQRSVLQASHAGGRMAPRMRLSYPGADEGTP